MMIVLAKGFCGFPNSNNKDYPQLKWQVFDCVSVGKGSVGCHDMSFSLDGTLMDQSRTIPSSYRPVHLSKLRFHNAVRWFNY